MRVGYHVVRASAHVDLDKVLEHIARLQHDKHGGRDIVDMSDEIAIGIEKEATIVQAFGLRPCAQIFIGSPMAWGVPNITQELAARLSKYNIVVHSSYVSSPWSGKSGSLYNLKRELRAAEQIGASVIIHMSAQCEDDAVLDAFAAFIHKNKITTRIWLETQSARRKEGPTTGTFESPEKINTLYARFRKRSLSVGICIDTAHVYACGVSFETRNFTERWLSLLDDMPIMFHLNDTTESLGSGKDVHIAITKGNIWRGYRDRIAESGVAAIVEFAQNRGSWIILENHTVDPFEHNGVAGDLHLVSSIALM